MSPRCRGAFRKWLRKPGFLRLGWGRPGGSLGQSHRRARPFSAEVGTGSAENATKSKNLGGGEARSIERALRRLTASLRPICTQFPDRLTVLLIGDDGAILQPGEFGNLLAGVIGKVDGAMQLL